MFLHQSTTFCLLEDAFKILLSSFCAAALSKMFLTAVKAEPFGDRRLLSHELRIWTNTDTRSSQKHFEYALANLILVSVLRKLFRMAHEFFNRGLYIKYVIGQY